MLTESKLPMEMDGKELAEWHLKPTTGNVWGEQRKLARLHLEAIERIAALEAENAALHEKIRETFEDAIKGRDRKADKLCDTVDGWKRLGLLCPVIESSYLHLNVICMTMQDQLLKERAENADLRAQLAEARKLREERDALAERVRVLEDSPTSGKYISISKDLYRELRRERDALAAALDAISGKPPELDAMLREARAKELEAAALVIIPCASTTIKKQLDNRAAAIRRGEVK